MGLRQARAAVVWTAALLATACGAAGEQQPEPRRSRADVEDRWIGGEAPRVSRAAPTSASPPRSLKPTEPIRIGPAAPPPEPARPRRSARVSVNLREADLPNALRLLAEAGGFGLVIEGDLPGTVSIRLEDVDAFEALSALATAHGASARYERGVVVVRGGRP